MANPKAAWGMEIGAHAIKAIRLERVGDALQVTDFAHIPHKKVLTTPDLDQDEMIRLSLGQFISQKSLEGEHLVMSVPGHAAFARFAKLPPVEPKKVPDIVKFEAVQQIPFPIEEVEWDYQTFQTEDSPEIEVGIFAITRERISHQLHLYSELGVSPERLTLSPVSVYNAMHHDLALKDSKEPVIFIDIGTQATDVIVAEEGRCWIRTFPLGGTHFTEAIANAFKLSYGKAEKLKQEAATSKYAKQIMQAMRPVFTDLLQDLQRSIGYYQSLHQEIELNTMVGIGSTFKIPGLRKFLGQQLQIDVVRLDEFKRINVTGREAAAFAENTVNLATAYGLALQGIGEAPIDANLMPVRALREQVWHAKTKWFGLAAGIIIVGALAPILKPLGAQQQLQDAVPAVVETVISQGSGYKDRYEALKTESDIGAMSTNMQGLLDYRDIWPHLINDASLALAATNPQPDGLDGNAEAIIGIDPTERRFVALESLGADYLPPEGDVKTRRMSVTMMVEVSHKQYDEFLDGSIATWLRDNAEPEGDRASVPYRITNVSLDIADRSELTATETGETVTKSGGGGRDAGRDRNNRGNGRGGRNGGARGGGGGNIQGGSGGGGALSSGGGTTQAPPGSRGGGGNVAGGSGGAGNTGNLGDDGGSGGRDGRGGRGGRSSGPDFDNPNGGGDAGAWSGDSRPINERAPVGDAKSLYPAGTKFYRVPVTFEIEIIDEKIDTTDVASTNANEDHNA